MVLMVSCAALASCTDLNSRGTIGAVRSVPALEAGRALAVDEAPAARLDRSDWQPIEYRLPPDGTVHAPLWLSRAMFDDDQRRAHGLYPTSESVLYLGGDAGEQVRLGLTEPARALVDLVVMPVRMVIDPAWEVEQSPSMYKRWRSGEWLAGPLPVEAADEAPAGAVDGS